MKEKLSIKNIFIKALPILIIVASVGIFTLVFKLVMNTFFRPVDTFAITEYQNERFSVVSCKQSSQITYYIYNENYVFDEEKYNNAGSEHDKVHTEVMPLVYITLKDSGIDLDNTVVKTIINGNGLECYQFDEFILYKLEGNYGILAPLMELSATASSAKNDLYVLERLMENDNYKNYTLNDAMTYENLLEKLKKMEWNFTEK